MAVLRLGSILAPTAGGHSFLGVEHEYRVLEDGLAIDFRSVIHELGLGQSRLDPGDPNAYRLPSGAKLTCDEREAELALPPSTIEPGFARLAARSAAAERADLIRRLPHGYRLEGHSTHISVAVPEKLVAAVARLYTERFALAYILLTDGSAAPGMAIRPRPGRVELCGEFIEGPLLQTACLFAAAGVEACVRNLGGRDRRIDPPPAMSVELRPVVERFGWFVDGVDLERLRLLGRSAKLRQRNGHGISAGEYLGAAWHVAREGIAARCDAEDLASVDSIIDGEALLPFEGPTGELTAAQALSAGPTVFGDLLSPRSRARFALAPLMVTWDVNIFMVVSQDATKRAFVCVPTAWLDSFLVSLDAGLLDTLVDDCLEGRAHAPRLRRRAQTKRPGMYRSICPRVELLPRERPADSAAGRGLPVPNEFSTRLRGWFWKRSASPLRPGQRT